MMFTGDAVLAEEALRLNMVNRVYTPEELMDKTAEWARKLADGPVNQAAAERALKHNVSLADIVRFTGELRKKTSIPVVFFTYFNPIFKYGVE